uniref:hypothetical protein n=1 Tax=Alloprevotella sp. TaxID=1872471 RepID=UPI003FEF5603
LHAPTLIMSHFQGRWRRFSNLDFYGILNTLVSMSWSRYSFTINKGEIPLVITKRLSPQIPADIRQYKTTKSGRGSLLRIPARFCFM